MSQMIFRPGNAEKWKGVGYDFKIVDREEVEGYLEDGWVNHPSMIVATATDDDAHESDPDEIVDKGELSDGYHTFNELYAHRVRLFSTLMRAFSSQAWWSFLHSDGEQWDGWIIAGIDTHDGPVTYHLPESEIQYLPEGTEIEFGKEWDGHTAEDVLLRLINLHLPEPEPEPAKKTRNKKAVTDEPND
ncbi:WDGH domain-containing protein [Hafnia alvei]|uniref:WDGH domain-containing protein n=1 Tax=Hafnia alvei TaxID=569 RepID=UPI003FD5FC38